jgi:hypothetical protein
MNVGMLTRRGGEGDKERLVLSRANTWRNAFLKALVVQICTVGLLSLGWFGFAGGFGGADNPLWFYVAAVLQFPASLLFTTVLGPIARVFPGDVHSIEITGAVVALVQLLLLAVAIKKIRDLWLS